MKSGHPKIYSIRFGEATGSVPVLFIGFRTIASAVLAKKNNNTGLDHNDWKLQMSCVEIYKGESDRVCCFERILE